jgi:YrbI family 3-deoxy-D-manno-octulosonate 8-phosphate phosphatase
MRYLFQGNTTKLPLFEEVLKDSGLAPEQIGYIGDDLTDLPLMRRCGLAAAPADSAPLVLEAAHFVTPANGGEGAVRNVIELLLVAQNRWDEVLAKYNV